MPFYTSNLYGNGGSTVTISSADPGGYVLSGVVIYQASGSGTAVTMDAYAANLVVDGTVQSRGGAVVVTANADFADITVNSGGRIGATNIAIRIQDGGSLRMVNNGEITASSGYCVLADDGADFLYIVNNGLMSGSFGASAISGGNGRDVVLNTGKIVSDVSLGGGDDQFENTGGTVTGTVRLGNGNDTYILDRRLDIAEFGDSGFDSVTINVDYALPDNFESLTLGGIARRGEGNIEDNSVSGNDIANVLDGYEGNDLLAGFNGNDTLTGGDGDDLLAGGYGADAIIGGDGLDMVYYIVAATSPKATNITINIASQTAGGATEIVGDTLSSIEGAVTGQGNDRLLGSTGSNVFIGFGGNDTVDGLAGDDTIEGGAGADSLLGRDGFDMVFYRLSQFGVNVNLKVGTASGGDAQGDTISGFEGITGGNGADTLIGSDTNNEVYGAAGNDSVFGNLGNDTLAGGGGNDTLNGGGGADVFIYGVEKGTYAFESASFPQPFVIGDDTIVGFTNGTDKFSFVDSAVVSGFADLVVTQVGSNTVIGFGTTGDTITLINFNSSAIDATDFLFG